MPGGNPAGGRRLSMVPHPGGSGAMFTRLANGLLFNASWLAIVITHSAEIACGIVLAHLALHFAWLGRGWPELQLVVGVALLGAALDSLLYGTGVFLQAGNRVPPPVWMVCLWPVFATTLMHAFAGLQRRPVVAALLGGVGGALSYVAGVNLTTVEFAAPLPGLVLVTVLWAVLFPSLLGVAAWLERRGNTPARTP